MGGTLGRIEFGGPDLPPRRLRDLLQSHVDASRPGSRIDWATYYFRDRALAEALIRASDRGVRVNLVMEPDPATRMYTVRGRASYGRIFDGIIRVGGWVPPG